jgi:hypothetical protein
MSRRRPDKDARRKGAGRAAFLIALPVLVVVGANFALVFLATSDPSFAVEEDYYRKALAWDQKLEQDRRNAELGWELSFEVAPGLSPDGTRAIVAGLTDSSGARIENADVRLHAFHNARASLVLEATLVRGKEAGYAASLPIRNPGLWEFRFEAVRGEDRLTHTEVRDVGWR